MSLKEVSLLIVGIDPGTTVGYAALDIRGNVMAARSSKELSLDRMVTEIIQLGRPILVGCDKAKIPGFVDDFAAKVGARLISPREDLHVEGKKQLVGEIKCGNSHEFDALASALFAFRQFSPLFRKIDSFLAKEEKESLGQQVRELVLKGGMSISGAIEFIEQPEEKWVGIAKQAVEQKTVSEKGILVLYNRVSSLKRAVQLLQAQNARLEMQVGQARQRDSCLRKKIRQLGPTDEKLEEIARFREKRVVSMGNELALKDKHAEHLQDELNQLYKILARIKGIAVIKKLKNLGWTEFCCKNSILNIQKEDVLLVDNPDEHSEKTIDFLKGLVDFIVCKRQPGKKLELPFACIDAVKLKIEEGRYFAFTAGEELEKAKTESKILHRIVEEYKKERAGS